MRDSLRDGPEHGSARVTNVPVVVYEDEEVAKEEPQMNPQTIREVFDSMTTEQKDLVHEHVGAIVLLKEGRVYQGMDSLQRTVFRQFLREVIDRE